MPPEAVLVGSYDYSLVGLSVLIAMLASYVALDFGGRILESTDHGRFAWLIGGAASMGMGIWAVHYIGMIAYSLPVPVVYDLPMVLWSLLAAIVAASVALYVVSRNDDVRLLSISLGGVVMGIGIAATHYIGMAAMRIPASLHFSLKLAFLSIVLGVVLSSGALQMNFYLRVKIKSTTLRKLASALLMGAAIVVVHYTIMAGVTLTLSILELDSTCFVDLSSIGIAGMGGVSLAILSLLMTFRGDGRFQDDHWNCN